MKKLLTSITALLLGTVSLFASPAVPGSVRVKQPDGTYVTITLRGDEYHHYNTTSDGYALVKDQRGYFVYAQADADGQLAPSALVAHDSAERTAADNAFLEATGRIAPRISEDMAETQHQDRVARSRALSMRKASRYDYSHFKGLIILVEYNDCPFRYDNYHDIMEQMINSDDYRGDEYTNIKRNEGNNRQFINRDIICTGSMRDYYRDNSNGLFVPTFDIIGPVQTDHSQYEANGTKGLASVMLDACAAADPLVNFKDYDTDGDGKVDMIYFIFSGLPSSISGNDERLLWPHQSDLSYYGRPRKDGVYLGRYACSTELYGVEEYNWSVLDGIGTMCHEFSHVLGLPDFYDTDNQNPQLCVNPGEWSLMAGGNYFNISRTPCNLSLFERYALGFAYPELLTEAGSHAMEAIHVGNSGFRINTPVNHEYFLLENRQKQKWDSQLPGHGMLIWRVDSTNSAVWQYNTINDNPAHPYYELIRANGEHKITSEGQTYYNDRADDPFPGTANVTVIDNTTNPANLLSWGKKSSPLGLRNIAENNGIITFDAFDVNILTAITLSEHITLGVGTSTQLVPVREPDYVPYEYVWTSDNETVATVDAEGVVTGNSVGIANITVTANGTLSATCQVTVNDMLVVPDIATFRSLNEGSEAFLTLRRAQVLYVYNDDIYLRDKSSSIILSNTGLNAKRGDVLNGILYGRITFDNQMPKLTKVDGMTMTNSVNIAEGSTPEPVVLHLSQLSANHYADLVEVENVTLQKDGGVFAVFGDKRIRLYNTLKITSPKISVPTDLNMRYTITAIFGTNTLNGQTIDELYLLSSPKAETYTAPTALSLPQAMRLTTGRTRQLTVTAEPANANFWIAWTSSDEQVVTVSQDGLLTAIGDGDAVITATDLETGLQAQCDVSVGERQQVESIAAFKALLEGSDATLNLTGGQVLYVNGGDTYLRDASGAIVLRGFSNLSLKQNMSVEGTLQGTLAFENQVPLMLPVEDGSFNLSCTTGEAAQPREVTTASLTNQDLADMIVLKAATLVKDNGIYAYSDDIRVKLYNTFKVTNIKVPSVIDNKYFDVTGILITEVQQDSVTYQLALLQSPVEVDEPNGIAGPLTAGLSVTYHDGALVAEGLPAHAAVVVNTLDGRVAAKGQAGRNGRLHLPLNAHHPAVYVVRMAGETLKMIVK